MCVFVVQNVIVKFFAAGYSVASNDRSFSLLKRVKNHLRTTMSEERLQSLMLIAHTKEISRSLSHDEIVRSSVTLKRRRIKL